MQKRTETAIWSAVVLTSIGLHAVAFGGLGPQRSDGFGGRRKHPAALVEMTVAPPRDEPPPPVAPTAAPLAMARPTRTRAARPAGAPRPPSEHVAPPAAEETPADFTGVTMTNDGPGVGWASAIGNGQAMKGAVGRPGARVTHRNVEGDANSSARGPGVRTVGLGDLSRAPIAPDLRAVLERLYPAAARSRGLAGKAVVRARIMPSGQVRELALLSESAPGFGAACEQTLRGSEWPPPLDRDGTPVSTFINYTCRFNVQ